MANITSQMVEDNALLVYNSLLFMSDQRTQDDDVYQPKSDMSYTSILEPDQQLKTGVAIWKYVIENVLKFDANTALAYIDDELVSLLKLDKTISLFGVGYKDKTRPDYTFILQFLYPKETKHAEDKHMMDICELAHKEKNTLNVALFWSQNEYLERVEANRQHALKNGKKFNDGYAQKRVYRGRENAIVCMRTIVYNHLYGNNTIQELYELFADENEARKLINSFGKIYTYIIPKFFATALDYFHESLFKSDRNTLWYSICKTKQKYDRIAEAENFDKVL